MSLLFLNPPAGMPGLTLRHLRGKEGVSTLFHFGLEVVAESRTIARSAYAELAKQGELTFGVWTGEKRQRLWHGMIGAIKPLSDTSFQIDVVPRLQRLLSTVDCRSFRDQPVP